MTKIKETFNLSYLRISQDLMHDINHRLYTKEHFLKVLAYLESKERYEDCANLLSIIKKRFDHKNNYIL